jgi:hypothetical protein
LRFGVHVGRNQQNRVSMAARQSSLLSPPGRRRTDAIMRRSADRALLS